MTPEEFEEMIKNADDYKEFKDGFDEYFETHSKDGKSYKEQVHEVLKEHFKIEYDQAGLVEFCVEHYLEIDEPDQLDIIVPYQWWLHWKAFIGAEIA